MQGVLKNIPVPPDVLSIPGHYSVVGLLPDDHTYAKGSLFILKPGTQGVVFDMDGAPRLLLETTCTLAVQPAAAELQGRRVPPAWRAAVRRSSIWAG